MLLILNGCSGSGWNLRTPPSTAQSPPVYPNASSVQTQTVAWDYPTPKRVTNFNTDAESDTILAYYKEVLTKDGWEVSASDQKGRLHFYWTGGCPVYGIDVIVESVVTKQTSVRLEVIETPCH